MLNNSHQVGVRQLLYFGSRRKIRSTFPTPAIRPVTGATVRRKKRASFRSTERCSGMARTVRSLRMQ